MQDADGIVWQTLVLETTLRRNDYDNRCEAESIMTKLHDLCARYVHGSLYK